MNGWSALVALSCLATLCFLVWMGAGPALACILMLLVLFILG